ncbi:MAG: hypothetical protein R3D58_03065 [Saprospiraceae bacterium]|jgi:hypothetical protein
MAETTRIKVKNAQAGDPHLSFTLQSEDGGTFPAQVKATANVTGIGSYTGSDTQNGGSASDINFTIQFTDPNYAREQSLNYSLSFEVPGARPGTWVPFGGTVDDGSGSVAATHDAAAADVEVIAEAEPATTAQQGSAGSGAKNKGCLAFLGMLPF